MTSTMNSYTTLSSNIKSGFDEAGDDLSSFLDLSFTNHANAVPLPTPTLFPISAPAYSNAFGGSFRQDDALLDSPLGLSPSLTASPFDLSYDFTSPLLDGSFSTPDLIDGVGAPDLGQDDYPSLFYNVAAPAASPQWTPEDIAAITSAAVATSIPVAVSPSMMNLDSQLSLSSPPATATLSRTASTASLPKPTVMTVVPPSQLTPEELAEEDRRSRQPVKDKFTGTRNTKIRAIDMDAPTLPKNYIIPSATSRRRAPSASLPKSAPAAKKGKRARRDSTPLPYEGETLDPDDLPDEMLSAIELKRRQNTLAARRSRLRKAGHLDELKTQIQGLETEVDEWKTKCAELEAVVRALRGC